MKCPYCKRILAVPSKAMLNVELYGSQHFVIPCQNCKGRVQIFGAFTVKFSDARITKDKLSW